MNTGIVASAPYAPSSNQYFDNTYWTPNGFIGWNGGGYWEYSFFNGGTSDLLVINSGVNDNWEVGYRPSQVEVFVNSGTAGSFPADFEVRVYDSGQYSFGTPIGSGVIPFSGTGQDGSVIVSLDFTGRGDIYAIALGFGGIGESEWRVTNIVFS